MQVFWRTAVYGPALCDLSVARTVKDARAQHPAHLPVPLQRRSPGFHRDNPAVIYRHSCSAGGGPRGSASRGQKQLKGTAGAPSGPPLINRFLLLLKKKARKELERGSGATRDIFTVKCSALSDWEMSRTGRNARFWSAASAVRGAGGAPIRSVPKWQDYCLTSS